MMVIQSSERYGKDKHKFQKLHFINNKFDKDVINGSNYTRSSEKKSYYDRLNAFHYAQICILL